MTLKEKKQRLNSLEAYMFNTSMSDYGIVSDEAIEEAKRLRAEIEQEEQEG